MKLRHLIRGDIHFQMTYGFYTIYALLTVLYTLLLLALPEAWKKTAATLLIFSDPAAMGLFFMGAIVLLEKSQRVLEALAVSPVSIGQYILSKLISLAIISTLVATILALVAGADAKRLFSTILGTALSSATFTLLGLLVATRANSLNQFLVLTVPVELLCFVPALLYISDYQRYAAVRYYPTNLGFALIDGTASDLPLQVLLSGIVLAGIYWPTYLATKRMWRSTGGVKL